MSRIGREFQKLRLAKVGKFGDKRRTSEGDNSGTGARKLASSVAFESVTVGQQTLKV